MAVENAEAAAFVFGTHGDDIFLIDDDNGGRCNQQSHDDFLSRFQEASFSRASSIVPTI